MPWLLNRNYLPTGFEKRAIPQSACQNNTATGVASLWPSLATTRAVVEQITEDAICNTLLGTAQQRRSSILIVRGPHHLVLRRSTQTVRISEFPYPNSTKTSKKPRFSTLEALLFIPCSKHIYHRFLVNENVPKRWCDSSQLVPDHRLIFFERFFGRFQLSAKTSGIHR